MAETIAEKHKAEQEKETGRVEAFSDAVFAIAITLLILEIHIPEFEEGESLMHLLFMQWASLVALLIGFFTILICWINHHYMFQLIHRSNSMLLLLNGFKLLVVTLTPLATALLSKHLQDDWAPQAVTIYCFNFALMGLAMTGIWIYAYHKGFANGSAPMLKACTRLYIFAAVFSAFIWLISFFSAVVCLILSFIMFFIFLFPKSAVRWQVEKRKFE